MISADIDPSLCSGEPLLDSLEDGFSPPHQDEGDAPHAAHPVPPGAEPVLTPKSPF